MIINAQRASMFCTATCIFMLISTVSNSMKINFLPKDELNYLHQVSPVSVQRKVKKLCEKASVQYNGNAKHFIKKIAENYKNYGPTEINKNTELISRFIGEKYSCFPNDSNNEIGTGEWLKQKKRNSFFEQSLKLYFSNPEIFAKTASNFFFGQVDEEVFT